MNLSLIVPVYNEQTRITSGINTILKYLKIQPYTWELIIVDDGSRDKTTSKINTTDNRIHLLSTKQNFGKGHAVRLGVAATQGKYIIFTDIDLSVPITTLSKLLKSLKTYDIVIGSRRLNRSNITKKQTTLRERLGQGFTQISNLFLNLHHTDHTCGFKGFKSAAAKKLFSLQKINRWAFDSEILFLASKLKLKVKEIPVTWKNDPSTKVNLLTDILQSAWSLSLIRINSAFSAGKTWR